MTTIHKNAARDKPSCVVLLSGGLDSAVCLARAVRDGFEAHAISFDYGQRHKVELAAAARVAKTLHAATHTIIGIDLRAIGGSALTSDIDVPKDRDERRMSAEIPVTYVPARNLVFLSLATGLAEVRGAAALYIGVNALDYSGYPDCRPEFIESFARTAALATKAGVQGKPLDVRAPLIAMSKAEIIRHGADLGVDFSSTHSCYDPVDDLACGRCDSCVLRRSGFHAAGVPDTTRYADTSPKRERGSQ
ncbi:MAG: 7-cyano-7-deazaguanine synthase QueC [Tepidisphaera sp.]|nr:7-cyano-7-deazaguanine synthase QueC [Tepidisphaera sp.]